MDFQIGDRVLLTENSEWGHQNKRCDDNGNEYEVPGEVVGRYVNGQREGAFDRNYTHFKYAVIWEDEQKEGELYYRDEDLRFVDPLPVTNQEAKNRLSKEW